MKNIIPSIVIATTVSTAAVAAPITFTQKVDGAYNYTQYAEHKKMIELAHEQEVAALNAMSKTFDETPYGDTAAQSSDPLDFSNYKGEWFE